ncbi:MAG: hypothetical protein WAL22_10010, partial [Solirubrobacteraceae bacterium]
MKIPLRSSRCVTDCEQALVVRAQSGTWIMPTLLDNAPQSLSAAAAQLATLRHRMLQMVEWFVALVVLSGVLLLTESVALAAAVGAGAVTALAIGGLAVDERRRLLLSLVAMGNA